MKPKEFFQFLPEAFKLRSMNVKALNKRTRTQVPVIVSLTSIPSRLSMLHYTVRSLLAQTVQPEKIVLWLNDELADKIPKPLAQLQGEVFEIRFSPLTCSHRKLIHSLETFPNSTIVTCDDDMLYPNNWLELLYHEHCLYPNEILANRCQQIKYDDSGSVLSYNEWPRVREKGYSSIQNIPIGCNGVLYPANSLDSKVTNQALFLELAPYADDLWFKAMSWLKETPCRLPTRVCSEPKPVPGTRGITLAKLNVNKDKNRVQWNRLANAFNIDLHRADDD